MMVLLIVFILVILYLLFLKIGNNIGIKWGIIDMKSSYIKWYNHFNLLITPIIITNRRMMCSMQMNS